MSAAVVPLTLADLTAAIAELKAELKTDLKTSIAEAIAPVLTRLDRIETRLDRIETRLDRAEAKGANDAVRMANGLKSLTAPLTQLLFNHSGGAWPADVAQPSCLLELAVSGAESMPGTHTRPDWNRAKSRVFLATAVAGYESDSSEGEGESGHKSRTARLKVIEVMGGSFERVIGSVYKLT